MLRGVQRPSVRSRPACSRLASTAQGASSTGSYRHAWSKHSLPEVRAPDGAPPLVILPGFGNNSDDYEAPFGVVEAGIKASLERRGWQVFVVPVLRKDWLKVSRALLTRAFWSSSCNTHPGYSWYLDRVGDTVRSAREASSAEQVVLVGHSAGGWLGRAFLADAAYQLGGTGVSTCEGGGAGCNPDVAAIVTLGTPQSPPGGGVRDMTGGALTWVNDSYPGAHFAADIPYVCVAGRTITADAAAEPKSLPRYACGSYVQVLGEGDGVVGDAVVPLESAGLEGAENLVLEGVFHSMSRIGTYSESSGEVWYGSEEVVDLWLGPLVEAVTSRGTTPAPGVEA